MDGGDTARLMIAARDNFTPSLFLVRSHNKLGCHIKILSAQEPCNKNWKVTYSVQ